MKSNQFFVVPFLAVALFSVGCGKDRAGDYKGNEIVQQSASAVTTQPGTVNQTAQNYAQSNTVTLKIADGSNENISGTYQSSAGTGTLTGKINDEGTQIQNVVLTMPQPASSSTVNGVSTSGCGGSFTGTLNITDTSITGSLGIAGVTQQPNTVPGTTATSYCAGMTRSVTLTK